MYYKFFCHYESRNVFFLDTVGRVVVIVGMAIASVFATINSADAQGKKDTGLFQLNDLPQNTLFRGPVNSSGVSGLQRDHQTIITNPQTGKRGVYGIQIGERGDHPCYIRVYREEILDWQEDFSLELDLCGNNGPTNRSLSVASFPDSPPNQQIYQTDRHAFVTGIEVCLNNTRTRLKGVRLFGKRVLGSGLLAPIDGTIPVAGGELIVSQSEVVSVIRNNCPGDGWSVPRFCPEGEVATAVVAHISPGNEPRDIVGLELRCRRANFGPVYEVLSAD